MSERKRLDVTIEQRALLPSRARARDAILRGTVSVNGQPASKPGQLVGESDDIVLSDPAAQYVSRAALKLIAGLDATDIDPQGKICLDLGASTGGFTQVLLERGAAHVHAVDVGHGQFDDVLGADPKVTSLEGVNARDLLPELIPEPVELIVSDVSFVSLTKILAAPLELAAPAADAVLLIKPQFEVGREHVGKGGIVSDEAAIEKAVATVTQFLAEAGWQRIALIDSPIAGGDGNREFLAGFHKSWSGSSST